jgi:hypothetical protein
MDEPADHETGCGITVPAAAIEAADELARAVREATRDLPFGTEPATFLAALERLAESAR